MNNSLLAKIAGWGQFALNALTQVATTGLPTGVFGWVGLGASLLMAIGTHAASNTGGPVAASAQAAK